MTLPRRFRSDQRGISYVEVLIAVILIAATAFPAADALHGAMAGALADTEATANHYRARGRLEEILAQPFSMVSAQAVGHTVPSSYSDAPGMADRRIVYVSTYDGDNADADSDPFTGTDPDLLWVNVEIEGTVIALSALKAR